MNSQARAFKLGAKGSDAGSRLRRSPAPLRQRRFGLKPRVDSRSETTLGSSQMRINPKGVAASGESHRAGEDQSHQKPITCCHNPVGVTTPCDFPKVAA